MAAPWEFAFSGLTFGAGTAYGLEVVEGLSMPAIRTEEDTRMEAHGAFTFARYLSARHVIFEGDIHGTDGDDLEDKINAMKTAFAPRAADGELTFELGDTVEKLLYCKPMRLDYRVIPLYSIGYANWAAEFVAGDPIIYSGTETTLTLDPGADSFGADFSIDFDLNFGGYPTITGMATNDGTFESLPVVEVDGPAKNPEIKNDTTGERLRFLMSVPPGSTLIIDFEARTAKIGSTSYYDRRASYSQWWGINPGANTIRFTAGYTDAANSVARVKYRSAWT